MGKKRDQRAKYPEIPDESFYLFSHYRATIGGWITCVPEGLLDNLDNLGITVTHAMYAISVTSFQDDPRVPPWTTNAIMAPRMGYDATNGDRQIRRLKKFLKEKRFRNAGKPYLYTEPLRGIRCAGPNQPERYDFSGLFEAVAILRKEGKGVAAERKAERAKLHVVEDSAEPVTPDVPGTEP